MALAVILLCLGQLQIWLPSNTTGHRPVNALVSLVLCAGLAVRRRMPFVAGIVGHTAIAVAFWTRQDTQILATSIAWFCVLYGSRCGRRGTSSSSAPSTSLC